jgi:hypothetical protein
MAKRRPVDAVAFDLGGVLVDWNPRHLYRKLFGGDEVGMERFLATICTQPWNEQHDHGRSFSESIAELCTRYPPYERMIRAYRARSSSHTLGIAAVQREPGGCVRGGHLLPSSGTAPASVAPKSRVSRA